MSVSNRIGAGGDAGREHGQFDVGGVSPFLQKNHESIATSSFFGIFFSSSEDFSNLLSLSLALRIPSLSLSLSLFLTLKKKKQGAADQANAPSSENPRGAGTGFDAHGEVATHGTTAKDELDTLGYDPVTGALAVAVEGDPGEAMGEMGGYKDPVEGNNPLPDQQERLRLAAAQAVEEEKKEGKK